MTLSDFTCRDMIVPQLAGNDAAGAIHELSQAMQRAGRIPDFLPFFHAALNREFLAGSDIHPGMAFPHARIAGGHELAMAVGRSIHPLRWGSHGAATVRLVFLVAVPETDSSRYLALMSGLARLTRDPGRVAQMHAARDVGEMIEVLRSIPLTTSLPQGNRPRAFAE